MEINAVKVNLTKSAVKVIRVRSLISEAVLSIPTNPENPQLIRRIKESAIRSCDAIEHIAEAILGEFIKPASLIQDLETAKHLLDVFGDELCNVRLNVPTKNEIDALIYEIRETEQARWDT